jgi:hypothetical protein
MKTLKAEPISKLALPSPATKFLAMARTSTRYTPG